MIAFLFMDKKTRHGLTKGLSVRWTGDEAASRGQWGFSLYYCLHNNPRKLH